MFGKFWFFLFLKGFLSMICLCLWIFCSHSSHIFVGCWKVWGGWSLYLSSCWGFTIFSNLNFFFSLWRLWDRDRFIETSIWRTSTFGGKQPFCALILCVIILKRWRKRRSHVNECVLTTLWRLLFIITIVNTIDIGYTIIELIISIIYNTSFTQYTAYLLGS